MITYSNPRLEAVIDGWPIGSKRTTATFRVETHPTRGQRGTRFTIDPRTGKPSATKVLTYAQRVRIVDGDDGRTYLLEDNTSYGFITVMRSNMQHQEEVIHARDSRFAGLLALFGDPAP
jgi:hypothetical protein